MNGNRSIYFLCPDTDIPSGGINVIYRLAEATKKLGYNACVLHEKEDFKNQWSPVVPPIQYWGSGLNLNTGDIVIIPETEPMAMSQLPDGIDKIVISLSWSLIFENLTKSHTWRDYGIKEVITNSGVVRDFIQWTMEIPAYKLSVPVDHNLFYFNPEIKKDQIIFMAHRNNQGELVEKIFSQLPRPVPQWEWEPINGLPHDQYAQRMRESRIFITTGLREGRPGPILEAMASGTIVVGYGGVGGNEYIIPEGPEQNAFKVENHDYFALCRMLEKVFNMIDQGDPVINRVRENALKLTRELTYKAESDSLKHFWENYFAG